MAQCSRCRAADAQLLDGVANVPPLERFAALVVTVRLVVRMVVAVQEVAGAFEVGREVLGQAFARPSFRLERRRFLNEPVGQAKPNIAWFRDIAFA